MHGTKSVSGTGSGREPLPVSSRGAASAARLATVTETIRLAYDRTPSAPRYMAGALWPKPTVRDGVPIPAITAHWRGYRASDRDVADFCALAGVWPSDWIPSTAK